MGRDTVLTLPDDPDREPGDPSPEEIEQRCAEIRATWDEDERQSRRHFRLAVTEQRTRWTRTRYGTPEPGEGRMMLPAVKFRQGRVLWKNSTLDTYDHDM